MARSVTELLPRPFADLTLDDVAGIIATVGDERETLWFERKAQVTTSSLAKACGAFANTSGGLLVVGVPDQDDTLVGIEPLGTEARLWVKETLRAHLLPMPPFRARWLPTDAGRGILLVLVEESSTTPHLLTRSGAIYVRNPGSSDPVPIHDQRLLLDLMRRGQEALERAESCARDELVLSFHHPGPHELIERLSLAATGVSAGFEQRLFAPETPDRLSLARWGPIAGRSGDYREPVWHQYRVAVKRTVRGDFYPLQGHLIEDICVERSGIVSTYRGWMQEPTEVGGDWRDALNEHELRARFQRALEAARAILLDYGGHGDARLAYRLSPYGRRVSFDTRPDRPVVELGETNVERWTDLDADSDHDLVDSVFAEIARAAHLGPPAAND